VFGDRLLDNARLLGCIVDQQQLPDRAGGLRTLLRLQLIEFSAEVGCRSLVLQQLQDGIMFSSQQASLAGGFGLVPGPQADLPSFAPEDLLPALGDGAAIAPDGAPQFKVAGLSRA
jgi:hypothetical protein